ncbi:MAG: hypothetical protein II206_12070, partial [Bacteroidaceae bacterium]|nr:hypothetical protein [Bacteroidaceae bacterium]
MEDRLFQIAHFDKVNFLYKVQTLQSKHKRDSSGWAEKSAQLEKNMFPVGKINLPSWKPKIEGLSGVFCIFARYLAFQYPKSDFVKVKLFYILEFGLAPPYILKTRTDGTQWCRPSLYFGLRPFFNICS